MTKFVVGWLAGRIVGVAVGMVVLEELDFRPTQPCTADKHQDSK